MREKLDTALWVAIAAAVTLGLLIGSTFIWGQLARILG
jgi:hypothetical protein